MGIEKPICIFYKENGCGALTGRCRKPEQCKFRKSDEQYITGLNATYERLSKLPETQQKHIADTYYGGMRIWNTTASRM